MNYEPSDVNITQKTYNQIAIDYSTKINQILSDSWVGDFERWLLEKFLLITVSPNSMVLDIGCGNGKDTNYLKHKGAFPIGIDISSGMLEEAKKLVPRGTLYQMDMRTLGFSNEVFDGVWANGCIYHVPKRDLAQVLKEVRRVLKPSGIFSFNFKYGSGEGIEENPKSYGGSPRFYAYYSIEEMKKSLSQASFKVLEIKEYPQKIFNEEIFHLWTIKP